MSRERLEESLAFVLKWEGSKFTNDPLDHGGATRYGIIQREYDPYRRRKGEPTRSVELITMDEVREIYQHRYWDAVQGDRLPVPLDLVMFDTGVLMGVGRAIRFLQQSLNVRVDGSISPELLGALRGADASGVASKLVNLREDFLHAIVRRDPTQQRFIKGWLNRLNDLRRTAGLPVPPRHSAVLGEEQESAPSEDTPVGRAFGASGQDGEEESGEATRRQLSFLETLETTDFLEAAASLRELARSAIYVLDLSSATTDVLRVWSGLDWLEMPVAAVASITPLGLPTDDPTKVLAALSLRPEFQSLVNTFRRLSGAAFAASLRDAAPFGARPAGGFGASPSRDIAIGGGVGGASLGAPSLRDEDEDPASPAPGDSGGEALSDLSQARTVTNFGAVEPDSGEPPSLAPLEAIPLALEALTTRDARGRTLPLDINVAHAFLNACTGSSPRVRYGLGAKVPFHGATPGKNFTRVDCSGFVREAIWRATTPHLNFPDGSVVQHDWIRAQGFQRTTPDDALLHDGVIRIAFLRPQDAGPHHVGHVALVHNARTLESHGGVGPDSRAWTKAGWQARAFVYVLARP